VVEAAIELLPTDAALVAFFDTGGSDAGLTRGGGGGGGGLKGWGAWKGGGGTRCMQ
jgi:hypothetical protein